MLDLERASCGLWLIERDILDLKRPCFCIWIIERGMLHLKRASFNKGLMERGKLHCTHLPVMAYRTRNITLKARLI